MNTKSLNKKLFYYSLTSAAVLAGTKAANAQQWSNDLTPDHVVNLGEGVYNINFEGDSPIGIVVTESTAGYYRAMLVDNTANAGWIAVTGGIVKPANYGYAVGASRAFTGANGLMLGTASGYDVGGNALFTNSDQYVSVTFRKSGLTHYGWILVHISLPLSSQGVTVKSYGYNQTPGATSTSGTLPVELTSFTAAQINGSIELKWETATEVNNHGFEIQRLSDNKWEKIGFVNGNGTSSTFKRYSFIDNSPLTGKVEYRLKQIDTDGKFTFTETVTVNASAPASFALGQNYPNPFNPSTKLTFKIPESGHVSLKVYNTLGQEVAELVNHEMEAGSYNVNFNAEGLPSGLYVYKIVSGNFSDQKKMLLIK